MLHRNPITRIAIPVIAVVAFALTGCVDNSGGEAPAGEVTEFEIAIESPDLACGSFEDSAHLIAEDADVDTFLEACDEILSENSTIADDLRAELALLDEGQALVIISAVLGGCLGDWQIEAVHIDGETLRPWMLKADASYGRRDVGCTADIGQAHQVLRVDGAAAATSVELTVGIYNPNLPGAPESTQDEVAE